MKYRTRSAKIQSDSSILSDIGKGTIKTSNRVFPLLSPFVYLYDYIISTLAFISRSFLRIKLGSRTFGLFTFIFLLLFTWVALYYKEIYVAIIEDYLPKDNHGEANFIINLGLYVFALFGAFVGMFAGIIGIIDPNTPEATFIPSFNLPVIVLISITFLWFLFHLRDVRKRKKTGEIIHSQYRGDSLLFDWIEGRKIFGVVMTPEKIWLIVEPIAVLSLSTLFWLFTSWDDLAYLLMLSGVCLFLEEYKIYKENKELEYNLVDQLLDGRYYAYLQQVVQEKIQNSEKEFAQQDFRATLDQRSLNTGSTINKRMGNTQYRAKVL